MTERCKFEVSTGIAKFKNKILSVEGWGPFEWEVTSIWLIIIKTKNPIFFPADLILDARGRVAPLLDLTWLLYYAFCRRPLFIYIYRTTYGWVHGVQQIWHPPQGLGIRVTMQQDAPVPVPSNFPPTDVRCPAVADAGAPKMVAGRYSWESHNRLNYSFILCPIKLLIHYQIWWKITKFDEFVTKVVVCATHKARFGRYRPTKSWASTRVPVVQVPGRRTAGHRSGA